MARYTEAQCRLCRRETMKLYLKGDRCYSDKCAIERRNYPPGQHGQGRGKLSDYGIQLREKQKIKTNIWSGRKAVRELFRGGRPPKGCYRHQLPDPARTKTGQYRLPAGLCQFPQPGEAACSPRPFSGKRQKSRYPFLSVKAWRPGCSGGEPAAISLS